jgi:hypothetical protein
MLQQQPLAGCTIIIIIIIASSSGGRIIPTLQRFS